MHIISMINLRESDVCDGQFRNLVAKVLSYCVSIMQEFYDEAMSRLVMQSRA